MEPEEYMPAPTAEASGSIKAISKDTVHQICSGQVVLSLAVAIKELVENAIDAGATLVEVRLREQGLESLEISDNGSGVSEDNLQAMTAKYHTSKIREFVDLLGVESFGFRGEALSSLCALADMVIVTRHKSSDVGIRIELDHEGCIKKRTPCARSLGTSVSLTNLFGTLPVRRRDFMRNIKKEFARMCQMLQAYCLVAKGVRIICCNQNTKGGRSVIVQTHGAQDVLMNISAVFGSRQTVNIIPLKPPLDEGTQEQLLATLTDSADETADISPDDVARLKSNQFRLEGFVSSCTHGAGRSSKDRQYFYVNSRPCEPKNITKVVNDFYHRYNAQQYPFVYLNVLTARSEVDVNLTPDKRQLLINNERVLLLAIKQALLNTYGNIPSTYKLQNTTIVSMLNAETPVTQGVTETTLPEESDDIAVPITTKQRFMDVLTQWKQTGDTEGTAPHVSAKRKCVEEIEVRTLKLQKIQNFLTQEVSSPMVAQIETDEKEELKVNTTVPDVSELHIESAEFDALTRTTLVQRIDCKTPSKPRLNFVESKPVDDEGDDDAQCSSMPTTMERRAVALDDSDTESNGDGDDVYAYAEICTSVAQIELSLQAEEQCQDEQSEKSKLERLRFKSAINPSQNQKAEDELNREFSKESFARMQVIGQFNLGFIIAKLDDDLFIIDQHASDEKYNFETLQRNTVLQYQPLAVPQPLEMTAINELVLLDHLDVFEKNGFKFEIDRTAPATKQVRLLGKPFSKNWEFGKEDIDELIFMLQDAPEGAICRPSRIRAMFASRACRKSVMIGDALNRAAMRRLVTHMGEIDQPWNCPHGRPTMRHLINATMLLDDDSTNADEMQAAAGRMYVDSPVK